MFKFKEMFKDLCDFYKNYWKECVLLSGIYAGICYGIMLLQAKHYEKLNDKRFRSYLGFDEEEES